MTSIPMTCALRFDGGDPTPRPASGDAYRRLPVLTAPRVYTPSNCRWCTWQAGVADEHSMTPAWKCTEPGLGDGRPWTRASGVARSGRCPRYTPTLLTRILQTLRLRPRLAQNDG